MCHLGELLQVLGCCLWILAMKLLVLAMPRRVPNSSSGSGTTQNLCTHTPTQPPMGLPTSDREGWAPATPSLG